MSLSELGFAFRHPRIAFSYLRLKARIAEVTETTMEVVNRYCKEAQLSEIAEKVTENLQGYEPLVLGSGRRPRKAVVYYVLCRITKPDAVVETGVQSGISSAFILQAMNENSKGTLYSIDSPDEKLLESIPSSKRMGMKSGWVVPPELRRNWELITGNSQDKLLPLLHKLKRIDIFIHDSDHSFKNMYDEFDMVWPFLRSSGILVSDDIHLNRAFDAFALKTDLRATKIMHTIGTIRKPEADLPNSSQ